MLRRRSIREPCPRERCIEPVSRSVPREYSSGSVPAVRGRREPNDQQSSARVTETGNRPGPVLPPGEALWRPPSGFFAPPHEARALAARDDLLADLSKEIRGAQARRLLARTRAGREKRPSISNPRSAGPAAELAGGGVPSGFEGPVHVRMSIPRLMSEATM